MHKRFVQQVEEMRRLIEDSRSASFLLAVSGGMDSMCMLDLFSKTLPVSDFAVAHCNFSLRGDESEGDQALVEARAAELGARLFVKRFDTVAYAQEHGISIEMAARELRYGWFAELCHEHGFAVLSVAHNANDNAETLMLNLLRGTGLNGLHGMDMYSNIPVGTFDAGRHVTVFRPLLEFTRKQIEGHVLTHRVPYRHDSSNFSSDYKRNKIRNEVFPVFEKINPSFIRTINRETGYFAEAGAIVEDWCRSQLPSVMSGERSGARHIHIDIAALLAIPHWRYLLYYILEPYGFNSQTLASVEDLLTSDRTVSGKRFESPTHMLLTTRDSLMVLPSASRSAFSKGHAVSPDIHSDVSGQSIASLSSVASRGITGSYDEVDEYYRLTADLKGDHILSDGVMVVRGSGTYCFNGSRFFVELLDRTPDMPLKQPAGTVIFDADALRLPFVCRRWRQGDWLIPLGMRGKKKVSDLFADLKYDTLQKDASIILVDTHTPDLAQQQHIAALLGARIDDRYKVTSSTRTILRITIL